MNEGRTVFANTSTSSPNTNSTSVSPVTAAMVCQNEVMLQVDVAALSLPEHIQLSRIIEVVPQRMSKIQRPDIDISYTANRLLLHETSDLFYNP